MDRLNFNTIFSRIKGCTFASVDSSTIPHPGFVRHTTGDQVILFATKDKSGYEAMVKRRLAQAGYDPDSFQVGPLPWGERVEGTPLILHKGKLYLQTVLLRPGTSCFTLAGQEINPQHFPFLLPKRSGYNQGLPEDKRVTVNTFALESIKSIHLLREAVNAGDLYDDQA